jgi:hypothetical protein
VFPSYTRKDDEQHISCSSSVVSTDYPADFDPVRLRGVRIPTLEELRRVNPLGHTAFIADLLFVAFVPRVQASFHTAVVLLLLLRKLGRELHDADLLRKRAALERRGRTNVREIRRVAGLDDVVGDEGCADSNEPVLLEDLDIGSIKSKRTPLNVGSE